MRASSAALHCCCRTCWLHSAQLFSDQYNPQHPLHHVFISPVCPAPIPVPAQELSLSCNLASRDYRDVTPSGQLITRRPEQGFGLGHPRADLPSGLLKQPRKLACAPFASSCRLYGDTGLLQRLCHANPTYHRELNSSIGPSFAMEGTDSPFYRIPRSVASGRIRQLFENANVDAADPNCGASPEVISRAPSSVVQG